jgi:penicillin amidase
MKPHLNQLTFKRWAARHLPAMDGRFYLPILQHPVTIQRDKWGIPTIHAHNRHDLFLAQGFVHAQDRLWQMELNRRAAHGSLSAVFGRITLDTDRLSRSLGFTRLAPKTWSRATQQAQADVMAYTSGVNAYLQSGQPLPLEFRLLRHQPDPWQPLDTIAYARLQMWALTEGASAELVAAKLIDYLGEARARELFPHYPAESPVTLPDGLEMNLLWQTAAAPFLGKGLLNGAGRGSNAWVIAASRSATGHAILCNDMHLPLVTPSIWHFQHLHSNDGLHVTGFTQPGLPYVLVGHNAYIAWGATISYIDCEDFFVEKLHPTDPTQYEFEGQWRQAEVINERITVRGQADHIETVICTHHGPIIPHFQPAEVSTQALALSSTALDVNIDFDGFGLLNQAKNWQDFVTAIAHISSPSLNILYADSQNNIGHWVSGRVPVRANGDGLTPAPGWTGSHEWLSTIPFAEMPHAFNPQQGYIVSANHRLMNDDYPHYLGQMWRNGYRAQRLEQLINSQDKLSVADCQRFQMDLLSIPGQKLVSLLSHLETADAEANIALEWLKTWDGWLDVTTIGGTVYEIFLTQLAQAALSSHLEIPLMYRYLGAGLHPQLSPVNEFQGYWGVTLLRWLTSAETSWLPAGEERDLLLVQCLSATTAVLRQTLGDDPQKWHWGRLHQVRFPHPLGLIRPFDYFFSPGPYPIGGDGDTVLQTSIRPDMPYENNAVSVSSRHIVDMGNLSEAVAIMAPGQSGHPGSPHYDDLIDPWCQGHYFTMPWRDKGETAAAHHFLTLKPAS